MISSSTTGFMGSNLTITIIFWSLFDFKTAEIGQKSETFGRDSKNSKTNFKDKGMERMGINLYTYFISSDLEIKLLRLK